MKHLDEAVEIILKNLKLQKDQFETAAVLATTEKEAKKIHKLLEKRMKETGTHAQLSYIDRDSSSFKKGITVTTFYLAKGLEFDQVFTIYGQNKNEPIIRQARYICATRALHELYMLELLD